MIVKEYIKLKEQEALDKGLEKEVIKRILIELKYQNLANLINDYDNEIDSHYFNDYLNQYLIDRKPIQYILGYSYFFENKFVVNSNVLIPRPETELVVEKAIEIIRKNHFKNVIDIGTGSGAIAVTIKKIFPEMEVFASDISIKALDVAKTNAKNHNVNINFIASDMFENITDRFDLIISNPPYIDYKDVNKIEEIVYQNEPHLSLFAGENGLYYYKEIINNMNKHLNNKGMVVFEIGYDQKESLSKYIKDYHPNYLIETYKDYNQLDRIVIISHK